MTMKNIHENTTSEEFRTHYYYTTELKKLAKEIGIKKISKLRKDELEKIIEKYLLSGKSPKIASARYINFVSDFLKTKTGRSRSEALFTYLFLS